MGQRGHRESRLTVRSARWRPTFRSCVSGTRTEPQVGEAAHRSWIMSTASEIATAPPEATHVLDLRSGDVVRVRSAAEIFATLDDRGTLDGLPFMPEMLKYCGRTLPVTQRGGKTCAAMASFAACNRPPAPPRTSAATDLPMTASQPACLRCSGRRHGWSVSQTEARSNGRPRPQRPARTRRASSRRGAGLPGNVLQPLTSHESEAGPADRCQATTSSTEKGRGRSRRQARARLHAP